LSGADVESKILSIHGIITEKDPKPQLEMMPKECPTCKVKNAFDAKFCVQCGQVLDAKAAIEMQEASEKTEQMAKTAMSPENMQAMLKEMMRTMIKEELHTE